MVIDVALGLPIDKIFKYYYPLDSQEIISGVRVRIPFRNTEEIGYVVSSTEGKMEGLKEIKEIIDVEPVIDKEMLELTRWMSERYFASWGECIEASLPSALRKGKISSSPRKEYFLKTDESFLKPVNLTVAQKQVLGIIDSKLPNGFNAFLLHGVTSSGKTEVYIRTIEDILTQGKSAIVLVPEIALTPQTISRFKARLRENVSVLHSKLTEAQKFQEWRKLKTGQNKVCIGTRSAIFAPLKNLGLIVIDEEHESSYKQNENPRYHAREVALKRAHQSGCGLILGSATPSLESYYKAERGEYTLLELPERVEKKKMPQVGIVDLKTVKRKRFTPLIFSPALKEELRSVIDRDMQAILFLNRRGFSTFISCANCGYVAQCAKCNLALTFHSKESVLICHYCNKREDKPLICPECDSRYLSFKGFGTQRVESELAKMFPAIRIGRLDSDVLKQRGRLEEIIEDFRARKIDVLVGTQIVAKGHDFPDVELVGVILADLSLNIVDFRSGERTFSLLTQVAGRSGRGTGKGRVIIQTYNPDHFTIKTSLNHDYKSFYLEEIKRRKQLGFPPFNELIKLEIRHKSEEKAKKVSDMIKEQLNEQGLDACDILGPAPHPVPKIRTLYRWTLLLKCENVEGIMRLLYNIIGFRKRIQGANIIVDVNPYED
ncbi:MAG: primosomal protein N' [Candidatus Saelkia tenebricola]|nr:primosomal protein N' [Candidatus Saelkia tenebricola]